MGNEETKGGLPPNNTGGSRMGARDFLLDKINRCKRELNALQTLEESIDWEIIDEDKKTEEMLYHYLSSSQCRRG